METWKFENFEIFQNGILTVESSLQPEWTEKLMTQFCPFIVAAEEHSMGFRWCTVHLAVAILGVLLYETSGNLTLKVKVLGTPVSG